MEKIKFIPDGQAEEIEFFVLEQTKLAGESYILVTDQEDGDAECMILKELPGDKKGESVYETVTDDSVLQAVMALFSQLLEDIDIQA